MTRQLTCCGGMALILMVCCCGCQALSPAQKEALVKLEDDLEGLEAKAELYERRIEELMPLVKEATKAHEEGRLPAAELAAIVADVAAKREKDLALLSETRADIRAVSGDVAALREQDVPVWRIVLPFVTALLGAAGGYIPSARTAAARTAERDACIVGVETAGSAEVKAAIHKASMLVGVASSLDSAVKARGG